MTPRPLRVTLAAVGCGLTLVATLVAQQPAERNWPQWRGPHATGVALQADPPVDWSETKNVRWKTEMPGRGSASPVVWGDRLFLLTAVPVGTEGATAHAPQGVSGRGAPTGSSCWPSTAGTDG